MRLCRNKDSNCDFNREYLNKFAELYNRNYPDRRLARQEISELAWYAVNFVRLTYRPIPKKKQALYDSLID